VQGIAASHLALLVRQVFLAVPDCWHKWNCLLHLLWHCSLVCTLVWLLEAFPLLWLAERVGVRLGCLGEVGLLLGIAADDGVLLIPSDTEAAEVIELLVEMLHEPVPVTVKEEVPVDDPVGRAVMVLDMLAEIETAAVFDMVPV